MRIISFAVAGLLSLHSVATAAVQLLVDEEKSGQAKVESIEVKVDRPYAEDRFLTQERGILLRGKVLLVKRPEEGSNTDEFIIQAFDLSTGEPRWHLTQVHQIDLVGDLLVAVGMEGRFEGWMRAMDISTGRVIWRSGYDDRRIP